MKAEKNDSVRKAINRMIREGKADLFSILLKGEKSRMYVADHFFSHPGRYNETRVKEWYLHNHFQGIPSNSIRIEVKKLHHLN